MLDVGCGEGWFLALLNEEGALYCLGIEPSKQRCSDIARIQEFDFEVLNGCVRDFSPERLGKFDIITMIGVLEHLGNPIADLEVIRSFMVDSSYLYIYTHNETPNLIIDLNKRISLVHQLYFTSKKIKILFKKVGFRIIDLKKRNTNMHILLQKCEPIVDFQYKINRLQHALLKLRYTVNKNIPSRYYSIISWFYGQYIGVLHRLKLIKIY
jgi:SAM-dependent methyltransferase